MRNWNDPKVKLPEMNHVVEAICLRSNGEKSHHFIRRIKTKDTAKEWQWSAPEIQTYFTLQVLQWAEKLEQ